MSQSNEELPAHVKKDSVHSVVIQANKTQNSSDYCYNKFTREDNDLTTAMATNEIKALAKIQDTRLAYLGLVVFYGISTLGWDLITNPVYIYIYIYIWKLTIFIENHLKANAIYCNGKGPSIHRSNMQKQKLHHFYNKFSPNDGPKFGRKY